MQFPFFSPKYTRPRPHNTTTPTFQIPINFGFSEATPRSIYRNPKNGVRGEVQHDRPATSILITHKLTNAKRLALDASQQDTSHIVRASVIMQRASRNSPMWSPSIRSGSRRLPPCPRGRIPSLEHWRRGEGIRRASMASTAPCARRPIAMKEGEHS